MKFQDLSLHPDVLKNLNKAGYDAPTAIQAEAIPHLLKGLDLLGIAQTGTGKTAAFALPMIEQLLKLRSLAESRHPHAVILVPTRELAIQIQESFERYAQGTGLRSFAIFGGTGQVTQEKAMRSGIDVVVATPGRFLDLMGQGYIILKKVQLFILDEADRMLDMGFIDDLRKIVQKLPKERQTMLFSATFPQAVSKLAGQILKDPVRIEVASENITADNILQKVITCKRDEKFQLLRKVLNEEKIDLMMVFTKTKNTADRVVAYLAHHHIPSVAIHGDKIQKERELALENFKAKRVNVLVATDVAARGIDIQDITHVVNFDLPLEPESYVHRIGRTARAGQKGVAISFCEESEKLTLEKIQRLIQSYLPTTEYKGTPEPVGANWREGVKKKVRPPTPGQSQEKTAYLDHSKRQRPKAEGETKTKRHPGFGLKKKKKK